MNTLQLQCFLEVADQLNYARAAETLHLTQPAVTKKIKSLEDELQVKLFDRDTRHVSLTEEGRLFYPNALSIYAQEMNVRASLLHFRQKKRYHLFIGTIGSELHLFLDEVLWNVRSRIPDLKADIVSKGYDSMNVGLETGSMDIIIGEKEVYEIRNIRTGQYEHLSDMPLSLLISPGIKTDITTDGFLFTDLTPEFLEKEFPGMDRLTCYELDQTLLQMPEIGGVIRRFSEKTVNCDNIEAAFSLVSAGFGYMFMPESPILMREKLRYIPLKDAPVFHYGCFYRKSNDNPALKILLEELERYFTGEDKNES